MANPRVNHLSTNGEAGEDDDVSSYKPIPESEIELRSSKSNLAKSKSREKVSSDGAEEKLLQKEKEAKISTRVDMADAKYVVGDHRNGDAKIELDANQKFSGLTKEDLLRYASDPFWVRLRWTLFALFWLLWLAMLAGAIAIIIRAPKCAPPPPKSWYEKGPLIDMSDSSTYDDVSEHLPIASQALTQGIFVPGSLAGDTYDVLDEPGKLDQFKQLAKKAKEYGIKLIIDLIANQVNITHRWFALSENKTGDYTDYFVWAKGGDYDVTTNIRNPPNKWRSTLNEPAWSWSSKRGEFYLHQYEANRPDLNFGNPRVVKHFDEVISAWIKAGADGIRLHRARQLLVNESLADEVMAVGRTAVGIDHATYGFYQRRLTSDQPALQDLLKHWGYLTGSNNVFTLAETASPELYLSGWADTLRPPSAAPLPMDAPAADLAYQINRLTNTTWPALQLVAPEGAEEELLAMALLLHAAPVFTPSQLTHADNETVVWEWLPRLAALRWDASIEHGNASVCTVADDKNSSQLLAAARWKPGHTGYAVVWNPSLELMRVNLSALPSLPDSLTVHHVTKAVGDQTNYTHNQPVDSQDILVPGRSSVMLSYVPHLVE